MVSVPHHMRSIQRKVRNIGSKAANFVKKTSERFQISRDAQFKKRARKIDEIADKISTMTTDKNNGTPLTERKIIQIYVERGLDNKIAEAIARTATKDIKEDIKNSENIVKERAFKVNERKKSEKTIKELKTSMQKFKKFLAKKELGNAGFILENCKEIFKSEDVFPPLDPYTIDHFDMNDKEDISYMLFAFNKAIKSFSDKLSLLKFDEKSLDQNHKLISEKIGKEYRMIQRFDHKINSKPRFKSIKKALGGIKNALKPSRSRRT